jgi:hypothetical protein
MKLTPEDFAEMANSSLDVAGDTSGEQIKTFHRSASAAEIQRFLNQLNFVAKSPFFEVANVALNIRLAENADLIADKITKQTDKLLKFTIGLWFFTIFLMFFAVVQIIIALMDYCSKNH